MTDERPIESTATDGDRPAIDADLLVRAYAAGVFPMADPESGTIEWFSPDPRAVLPVGRFHVPRNLARRVRQGRFEITSDRDFAAVIRACGEDRPEGTWLDDRLVEAFLELHERGVAHCVEARIDGELVGGLYGVHLGGAYFGESMFSRPGSGGTDASKVCLVHLVEHLRAIGVVLLDAQFWNPHLAQFGCEEIPRSRFLVELTAAIHRTVDWDADGFGRRAAGAVT